MEQNKRRNIITLTTGQVSSGEPSLKKSRANRKRARTTKTYQNKINKLQAKYRKYSKHEKFITKYPTFEKWMEKFTMKQVGKDAPKSYTPTVDRSALKKSVWGR